MEEYTTYGKPLTKNLRKILLNYKSEHSLTNQEMAQKCDISVSEYDKIMNVKRHGSQGCSSNTIYKIGRNLHIDFNDIYDI